MCGKPCHSKNFSNFSKWGKGHRLKTTTQEIILMLEVMREEERKRTVLAIARKVPDIPDYLSCHFFVLFLNNFVCEVLFTSFISKLVCV